MLIVVSSFLRYNAGSILKISTPFIMACHLNSSAHAGTSNSVHEFLQRTGFHVSFKPLDRRCHYHTWLQLVLLIYLFNRWSQHPLQIVPPMLEEMSPHSNQTKLKPVFSSTQSGNLACDTQLKEYSFILSSRFALKRCYNSHDSSGLLRLTRLRRLLYILRHVFRQQYSADPMVVLNRAGKFLAVGLSNEN